jgi:hypothetical protein
MTRLVLRNLLLVALVALPATLATGGLLLAFESPAPRPPLSTLADDFLAGMIFWWVLLVLPALVIGFLHQVALAALPHDWSARRTRVAIVATSIFGATLVSLPFAFRPGARTLPILVMSCIGATLYGLLATRLRPEAGDASPKAV